MKLRVLNFVLVFDDGEGDAGVLFLVEAEADVLPDLLELLLN